MSDKQEAPIGWRPYPPVKRGLERLGKKNMNYFLNSAVAAMIGVPQVEVDKYKRNRGDS